MASLELKLFYLRTRVRQVSQRQMAADLSVRQAKISELERGQSKPSFELLLELCRYFDVRADYFLDDSKGVIPYGRDRWSVRDSLVCAGMWVEVPREAIVELPDGKALCPLLDGEMSYDDEAKSVREREAVVDEMLDERSENEAALETALATELREYWVRRGRWRSALD